MFGHLYSLEMTKDQFLQRMVAAEGRIHSQKLRDPVRWFDASDWERYSGAMARDLEVPVIAQGEKIMEIMTSYEMKVAKRMLLKNMPMVDIVDITGLSIEEVEKLKEDR